jgi:hypothetical protein
VTAFATQSTLCEPMSSPPPVLERHLSPQAIVSAKQHLATLTAHIAALLHARIPAISLEDCASLAGAASTWVAGVWPAVMEVLSRAELADRIFLPSHPYVEFRRG